MPGRRKIPGANRAIAFDREVLEAIDETAAELTIGRSKLVNYICRDWLESVELPSLSGACGKTFAAINPGSARAYLSLHVEKETGVASDWNG